MEFDKYDTHIHTSFSIATLPRINCRFQDAVNKPRTILKMARKRNLRGVVITDHNTVRGGQETIKLKKQFSDINIIPGEELTIRRSDLEEQGHLKLYPMKKEMPEKIKNSPLPIIRDYCKDNNIIMDLAHPFVSDGSIRSGLFNYQTKKINKAFLKNFDSLETHNSLTDFISNSHAQKFYKKVSHKFAESGGSDSHFRRMIGTSHTLIPSGDDLIESILKRKTKSSGRNRNTLDMMNYIYSIPLKAILNLLDQNLKTMLSKVKINYTPRDPTFEKIHGHKSRKAINLSLLATISGWPLAPVYAEYTHLKNYAKSIKNYPSTAKAIKQFKL